MQARRIQSVGTTVGAVNAQVFRRAAQRRHAVLTAAAAATGLLVSPSFNFAATTFTYANPALVSPTVGWTQSNSTFTVSTGSWNVGDIVRFTGTTTSTNPFGTSAGNYYV